MPDWVKLLIALGIIVVVIWLLYKGYITTWSDIE